ERVVHRIDHGRRFIAAVHHALGAFLVIAGAVGIPVRFLHQLLEALRIALAEQVAGTLPAEIIARRIAPRRAAIALIAGEEIEEQARLIERPALAVLALEDFAEQLLRTAAAEEVGLIRRPLISVAWRDGDAIDSHLRHRVEE